MVRSGLDHRATCEMLGPREARGWSLVTGRDAPGEAADATGAPWSSVPMGGPSGPPMLASDAVEALLCRGAAALSLAGSGSTR